MLGNPSVVARLTLAKPYGGDRLNTDNKPFSYTSMKHESSTLNVHQFGHPDICVVTCDKGDPFNNMEGDSKHLEERTLNHITFDFFTFTST